MSSSNDPAAITIAGTRITHPDRVVYPSLGVTKGEVAAYLDAVAEHMLPYVARRPISLVRCPRGREASCFFQKHRTAGMPEALRGVMLPGQDQSPYLWVADRSGLVAAAQIGALEIHPWGAEIDDIDHPDRLVFDLDPDEGVDFDRVVEAARLLRRILESAALASYPLLTGGKGVHVVVPLAGRPMWEDVRRFSRGIAAAIAADRPQDFTIRARKARRSDRIFIDWMRNARGATAIAPYSMRARPGGPAAVPVRWGELDRVSGPDAYSLRNVTRRLAALKGDPWAGFGDADQRLPDGLDGLFPDL